MNVSLSFVKEHASKKRGDICALFNVQAISRACIASDVMGNGPNSKNLISPVELKSTISLQKASL